MNAREGIIESLRTGRSEDVEMMSRIANEPVEFEGLISEEAINEANSVTFDNKTYPKDGWAVVMAGGAGSGKGFVIGHQVLIDAKIVDVDQMKNLYNIMQGGKYDLTKPEDVHKLHLEIDAKGWKDKVVANFFASAEKTGKIPNVVFDITGKSVSSLERYTMMAKEMGYKVSFVWVVTNRNVAIVRNLMRSRVVPQNIFHQTHNQVRDSIFPFLKGDFARFVDEAWIVFSGDMDIEVSNDQVNPTVRDELKGKAFKLVKMGDRFTTLVKLEGKTVDIAGKVAEFLGPEEVDYNEPQIYKDFDDVNKQLQGLPRDDKGKIVGTHKINARQYEAW